MAPENIGDTGSIDGEVTAVQTGLREAVLRHIQAWGERDPSPETWNVLSRYYDELAARLIVAPGEHPFRADLEAAVHLARGLMAAMRDPGGRRPVGFDNLLEARTACGLAARAVRAADANGGVMDDAVVAASALSVIIDVASLPVVPRAEIEAIAVRAAGVGSGTATAVATPVRGVWQARVTVPGEPPQVSVVHVRPTGVVNLVTVG